MLSVMRGGLETRSVPATGTFSNNVWADVDMPTTDGVSVGSVLFEPCGRTYWHSHPGGQLLIILAGEGFVGAEGETIRVRAGDKIWTPPGVRHWHGATSERFMIHTAVSIGVTVWEGEVTEAEYPGPVTG